MAAASESMETYQTGEQDAEGMRVYSSVEELAVASDLVAVGTVQGVVAREVDYGAANTEQSGAGVPIVFYGVAVTETLRGETRSIVIVGAPDADGASIEGATALLSGQQLLLFLKQRTREVAPGVKSYEVFFEPVGLSNGVFDVLEDGLVAHPRMQGAFEEASYRLTEVRTKVRRSR